MLFKPEEGSANIPLDYEADGHINHVRNIIHDDTVTCNCGLCKVIINPEHYGMIAEPLIIKASTVLDNEDTQGTDNYIRVSVLCGDCLASLQNNITTLSTKPSQPEPPTDESQPVPELTPQDTSPPPSLLPTQTSLTNHINILRPPRT